jgi:hypothetical protein
MFLEINQFKIKDLKVRNRELTTKNQTILLILLLGFQIISKL